MKENSKTILVGILVIGCLVFLPDILLKAIGSLVGLVMLALLIFGSSTDSKSTRDWSTDVDSQYRAESARRREAWKQEHKPTFYGGWLYTYTLQYLGTECFKLGVTQGNPDDRMLDWTSKRPNTVVYQPGSLKQWAIPANVCAGDLELALHDALESLGFHTNRKINSTEVFQLGQSSYRLATRFIEHTLHKLDLEVSPTLVSSFSS